MPLTTATLRVPSLFVIALIAVFPLAFVLSFLPRPSKKGSYTNGQWNSYGDGCSITMGSIPTTQLIGAHCDQTFSDLMGYFNCVTVQGATEYEFEFTNSGLAYSFTISNNSSNPFIKKNQIAGLLFGNSYNVRVRAKVNGIWGAFGNTCSITLSGSVPNTELIGAHCGQTFSDLSGYFNCIPVQGATQYEFEFVNNGLGYNQSFVTSGSGPFISKKQLLVCYLVIHIMYEYEPRLEAFGEVTVIPVQ